MKRILCAVVSVLTAAQCLCTSVSAVGFPYLLREFVTDTSSKSGSCGADTVWELKDGVLTVTGTGEISKGTRRRIGTEYVSFTPENYDKFYNEKWVDIAGEIRSIVIGEGITEIGAFAFGLLPELESVTMPDSLKTIGNTAFMACPKLKAVIFPDSVETIGHSVFDGDPEICDPETGFCIINHILLEYIRTDQESLVIPDTVTRIAPAAFQYHEELVSIKLPTALTKIEKEAFSDCISLTEIRLPDSVSEIGANAFEGCMALQEITLPSKVTVIPSDAFTACASLKTVNIPDTVTEIRSSAFSFCTHLQTVSGCVSLEKIGEIAFEGCELLSDINLSDSLRYVSSGVFSDCTTLEKACTVGDAMIVDHVLIRANPQHPVYRIPDGIRLIADSVDIRNIVINCPDSLRIICDNAFANHAKLLELNLNNGCESVGENALSGCQWLQSIRIPESVQQIGKQDACSLTDMYGIPGAAAESFATDNQITFHDARQPVVHGRDMTLDIEKDVWSFGNWGEVFGGDYYLTDADRNALKALNIDTQNVERDWSGSCAGLAITVILMKSGIFAPAELQSGAASLREIEPSKAVQSFINYYQCTVDKATGSVPYEPDINKFYRMLKLAENVKYGESPFMLTIRTQTGLHAVVGYGQESDEWIFDGKNYDGRILIWDSNSPKKLNDDYCLYYDSVTFDYCIPHYGIHVTEGAEDNVGEILAVCNDLDILNAYPYPNGKSYETGDLNLDGSVTIADVVLMSRYLSAQATLSTAQMQIADLSGNGNVNAVDQTLLKRILIH